MPSACWLLKMESDQTILAVTDLWEAGMTLTPLVHGLERGVGVDERWDVCDSLRESKARPDVQCEGAYHMLTSCRSVCLQSLGAEQFHQSNIYEREEGERRLTVDHESHSPAALSCLATCG